MATVDKLEIDGVVRDIQDKSLTETVNTLSLDYQETKNKVTDIEGDVAELQEIVGESAVTSVNGKSGAVTLDAEDVGAAPASHVNVTGGENVKGHVKVTTDFSNATDNDVVPSAPAVKTAVNNLQQAINSKSTVPTNHASSDITYGIGTSSNYGHVKVDNTYDKENPEAADGVAASAYALQSAYNELKQRPVGVQSVNGKTGSNVTLNASDVNAAPSNHASPTAGEASPVYGGGTSSQFGHVSLTDVYDNPNTDEETDGAANSKAASAYAVQAMYKEIMESGAGGGTYVEANPTLSGGEEALTAIQIGSEKFSIEGGGGGVSDYTELENKPSINNVELDSNKTSSDLGLAPASHTHTSSDVSGLAGVATSGNYNDLSNKPSKLSDFTDDLISIGNVEPSASSEVEIFIDESEDYASGIPSASQASLPDYSTTEYKIGRKWIDGNDIWEKVIDFGVLPNNAQKSVAHGITFDKVIKVEGCAHTANYVSNLHLPSIVANASQYDISLECNTTDIVIITGTNRSSYSAYVIVQYTKS